LSSKNDSFGASLLKVIDTDIFFESKEKERKRKRERKNIAIQNIRNFENMRQNIVKYQRSKFKSIS